MQHKHGSSRLTIFLALFAAVLVVGAFLLMTADIPAPSKPVEKELDAKAFLGEKQ